MGWNSSTTTVTNTPAALTPVQEEQQRLMLEELRRQNDLAAQLMPNQQLLIDQQRQVLQYQIDHQGDMDALHSDQLRLANLQIQQQINDAAMQEQLRPEQLSYLHNSNQLALQQIDSLKQTTAFQSEQNKYIIDGLRDQAARIAARNKFYSPEEEAQAAADEARRSSRMSAISEEAANIQLKNLKQGTKPTEEQLANINEAYDATQARGESDISRYLKETLRTINDEAAQSAGLRSTDTPMLRLSERAGEEAARAQGNLTETVAGGRATARLNYPLAASQLAGNQAAALQTITGNAVNFQDQLRLQAATNRGQAFGVPQNSIGFAMPQSGPSANLSFMNPVGAAGYNPGAYGMNFAQFNTNPSSQTSSRNITGPEWLTSIGNLTSGMGRAMQVSDVRAKTDIRRVGETDAGLPIYTYRYKGDGTPRIGVMAQEVARIFPEAVGRHPSGFLAVDHSKVH